MKKHLVIGILAALLVGSLAGYYWVSSNAPISRSTTTENLSSCEKLPGDFLIIADLQGFNDSVSHLRNSPNEPWPVIKVHKGERVNIVVCDLEEDSPHGFAIRHYFEPGVALTPHESFRISFVADDAGNFTIYCTIPCPVHTFMLSGQLSVMG